MADLAPLSRRSMLSALTAFAAAGAGLGIGSRAAIAQALDSLHLFIPAAPGGGWDQTGRAIETAMREAGLVKTVQFTHKPGAGGAVGLPQFLNQNRGQANTLMVGGMVMVGSLIANKTPVSLSQATPIARLTGEFEVVVVNVQSPHKTMKDLVAAFKADPGKVSWAGGSAGGTDHILVGMIAQAVGVDTGKINYVAYAGGGPAQAALLGNHVTCGVSGWGEFQEQVKAGKLRALAISSDKRAEGVDVPTLKEQGVDVELFNWRSVFAPPGINDAQRKALLAAVDALVKSPAWQTQLKQKDWTGIYLAGDDFTKYLAEETTRIHGILKSLGLAT